MSRTSVKQQLIARLEREIETTTNVGERHYYELRLAQLRARGSGSLPWWARDMAYRWRLT